MSIEYRKIYASLGEERVQRAGADDGAGTLPSADSTYWDFRKDENWIGLPGSFKRERRTRKLKFICAVPQILVDLEPDSTFSSASASDTSKPSDAAAAPGASEKASGKEKAVSKKDQLKANIEQQNAEKKLCIEVTRIRNSKSNLLDIIRDMSSTEARLILIVEILNSAYTTYQKTSDKRLLYEALWALNEFEIKDMKVPMPTDMKTILVRDYALVYDVFANVEKLVSKCRKVMNSEADLIKTQLNEMSDRLPPLSRFSFGFKLDEWQKKVLRWIKDGKSALIVAPTSSGKTVLSTTVATLAKRAVGAPDKAKKDKTDSKAPGNDDDEDFVDSSDEEDDDDYSDDEGAASEQAVSSFQLADVVRQDYERREKLREYRMRNADEYQRVLFVVPSEPLVWQVAAYFTKLFRDGGDFNELIAIVTDQMTYYTPRKINTMPPVVIGTPMALETALTKPRGLAGRLECFHKAQGDYLPGGFDHFDWVIYDEVHSLDGAEGDALQRIIRSMKCKFLALSATIGNAEELRAWMEVVKKDQCLSAELLTVTTAQKSTEGDLERVLDTKDFKVVDHAKRVEVLSLTGDSMTWADLKAQIQRKFEYMATLTADAIQLTTPAKVELYDVKDVVAFLQTSADKTIEVHTVTTITHEGRFINLQRYVWKDKTKTLDMVSPIAAVETVGQLESGILENSSLSFTARDLYSLWEKLKETYPMEAIQACSPYNFFDSDERITLQRTKDYESLIKRQLKVLATQYPLETQELLHVFNVEDPEPAFDLCDLVLDLKGKDMLPCLPFHLNTFEAIKLFQQLLSGLEWRQKRDHPTYYHDQKMQQEAKRKAHEAAVKATGRNEKNLEDLMRAGELSAEADFSVDQFAPHPNYIVSKGAPISERELSFVADEMERYDGFEKRDGAAMREAPGKNLTILKHALIRGLRRGIGVFIDEVSFPSYRKTVQRLASKGRLGVVISDYSLAFGVNMPFRSCIFCGEMYGQLDELMAQQMSGRAGRRGLDTQGNLIYAGIAVSTMRRLMIGKVSDIIGSRQTDDVWRNRLPYYDSQVLQTVLSPRHVDWSRAAALGGISLYQFAHGQTEEVNGLRRSTDAMIQLGFLSDLEHLQPSHTFAHISVIWSLRENIPESVTIGLLLPALVNEFSESVRKLALSFESKAENREIVEELSLQFLAVLSVLVNRREYNPTQSHARALKDLNFFSYDHRRAQLDRWLDKFDKAQASIPGHLSYLREKVDSSKTLDGTFFQCILDRKYVHALPDTMRQEMKQQIWHVGNTIKAMHNCCWSEEKYHRISYFIFRVAFAKIRYLNSELIQGIIDFDDISSEMREGRTDGRSEISRLEQSLPWKDNDGSQSYSSPAVTWADAIVYATSMVKLVKSQADELKASKDETDKRVADEIRRLTRAFSRLSASDADLLQGALGGAKAADKGPATARALAKSSFGKQSALHLIGAAAWHSHFVDPSLKLPMLLKFLYDDDLLSEEAVRQWHAMPFAAFAPHLPAAARGDLSFSEDTLKALQKSCNIFIEYLDHEDDEDDEDDEDEDDEEEDDE